MSTGQQTKLVVEMGNNQTGIAYWRQSQEGIWECVAATKNLREICSQPANEVHAELTNRSWAFNFVNLMPEDHKEIDKLIAEAENSRAAKAPPPPPTAPVPESLPPIEPSLNVGKPERAVASPVSPLPEKSALESMPASVPEPGPTPVQDKKPVEPPPPRVAVPEPQIPAETPSTSGVEKPSVLSPPHAKVENVPPPVLQRSTQPASSEGSKEEPPSVNGEDTERYLTHEIQRSIQKDIEHAETGRVPKCSICEERDATNVTENPSPAGYRVFICPVCKGEKRPAPATSNVNWLPVWVSVHS